MPSRQIKPSRRAIVRDAKVMLTEGCPAGTCAFSRELPALRILQQQSAPLGGRDDRDEPLDDRLEQGVELGLLAES